MESISRLELLEPETQTLILCHISCRSTLYSLLRASPRFYQVFISRREYHLTQLAIEHSHAPANAWDTFKASGIPKPPSHEAVETFVRTFTEDNGYMAPVLSLKISVPIIKLGACVEWFIADFTKDTLANLITLGKLKSFEQNMDRMHRELSTIEKQRIARAFFRLETFSHLFPPRSTTERIRMNPSQLAIDFLNTYELDEIEEIVCVRDYLVRKLWVVFDRIEDDFVGGKPLLPQPEAAQALSDDDWFGEDGKEQHGHYMEKMISLGLPFLQKVLTADRARSSELVLSNSLAIRGYFTDTVEKAFENEIEPSEPSNQSAEYLRNYKSLFYEDATECSIGWHWGQNSLYNIEPGYSRRKGCRDWGYIFWEKTRMDAAGVLDRSYFFLVLQLSGRLLIQRLNRAHEFGYHYLFEDTIRSYEPSALARLKDPGIKRVPNAFRYHSMRSVTPE